MYFKGILFLKEEYYIDMRKTIYIIVPVLILALTVFGVWFEIGKKEVVSVKIVTNFKECADEGNPIMESYPRQCRSGDKTFVENIGKESDIANLIRVSNPLPNQIISSPLVIKGEARGSWFFEASFPVVLTDWDGLIIAQGIATAQSDWMTADFVPFTATLTFKNPTYKNNGSLILKKDNPSGLPEHDNALEFPIIFKNIDNPAPVINNPPTSILPYDSGISGRVTIGPVCPVMKNPSDLNCADKPYQTTVQIILVNSSKSSPFATVETDKDGQYKIMLPPGDYAVQPVGGKTFPRCNTENVNVEPKKLSEVNISCDTGIR